MIIHALSLTLTDQEIVSAIQRTFEMNKANMPAEAQGQLKNIKDVNLSFTADQIKVSGKFVAGFLPVPFEGVCEPTPSADGETLVIRLVKVKAAFFSGSGEALLKMLSQQIPPMDGIQFKDDAIHIQLRALLRQRGLQMTGKIRSIRIVPGQLTFEIA